jgi:hypothetical protein
MKNILSLAIVLAKEDVEVHFHAPQTETEHSCVYGRTVIVKNCIIVRKNHLLP